MTENYRYVDAIFTCPYCKKDADWVEIEIANVTAVSYVNYIEFYGDKASGEPELWDVRFPAGARDNMTFLCPNCNGPLPVTNYKEFVDWSRGQIDIEPIHKKIMELVESLDYDDDIVPVNTYPNVTFGILRDDPTALPANIMLDLKYELDILENEELAQTSFDEYGWDE